MVNEIRMKVPYEDVFICSKTNFGKTDIKIKITKSLKKGAQITHFPPTLDRWLYFVCKIECVL